MDTKLSSQVVLVTGASGGIGGEVTRAFVQEGAILAELSERSTAIVQARDTANLVT